MINSLNTALGAAAVGPCLLGEDMNPQAWDHGELDLSSGTDSPKSFYEPRTEKAEVAWVSGAASLVRTAEFKVIGGFDENFFLYKEEEDLSVRLRQAGHKVFYDPSIHVQHIGSVVANKDSGYFEESIAYYDQKHSL